jgi:hypothetical protein
LKGSPAAPTGPAVRKAPHKLAQSAASQILLATFTLILQAVSWYLRYPLSYRDIEELFLERRLAVDHSTLTRLEHRILLSS